MFIVLNHRAKTNSGRKNGRTTRFIFSIASIVPPELPGFGAEPCRVRLVAPDTLFPPLGVWKSIFLHRSGVFLCLLLSNQHTRHRRCSAPVVFRCARRRHLASKLSSSSATRLLRLCFCFHCCCWPDFYKLKECVLSQDFVVFCSLLPMSRISIFTECTIRTFSPNFTGPGKKMPDVSFRSVPRATSILRLGGRRLTLNFSQQQRALVLLVVVPTVKPNVCAVLCWAPSEG